MVTTRRQIDDFWALKRLAIVGVSRDPKHFSNQIWQELRQRRYDVVPVNPNTDRARRPALLRQRPGHPAARRRRRDHDPADRDRGGRPRLRRGRGEARLDAPRYGPGAGSVSPAAVQYCEANGIDVVAGFCPYMFLPGTPFFHGLHAFAKKVTGSYPR